MSFVRGKIWLLCGVMAMLVGGPGCPQPHPVHRTPQAATQSASEAAIPHSALGRIYEPQESFSIMLPTGWRNCGASEHHFMSFLGPIEGPFTVNFNVLAQPDDGTPVEQARSKVLGFMPLLLKDYHMVKEDFTYIAGEKVYVVSGTFNWKGQNVQNLQYCIRGANKRIYILTFAAPVDTFAKHQPVFEQTAKTVIIR